MRSAAKGGGQGWTVLLADDSKGVHGKSISPATSHRGRSLLWFTLRLRLGNLGFVDVDSLACRSALGLPALAGARCRCSLSQRGLRGGRRSVQLGSL